MDTNSLVLATLIANLTFRLNIFGTLNKEQVLNKVFNDLSTGKVSSSMVAISIGNMYNLPYAEIEELVHYCRIVSPVN